MAEASRPTKVPPKLAKGRVAGEPVEEMDDEVTTRARRSVRADPLSSPDEPMQLLTRPWDVAPGDRSRDLKLIIQRELCTVGEARAAVAAARASAGEEARAEAPRLVVAGMELLDDEQLVWDAGIRTTGPVMYVK